MEGRGRSEWRPEAGGQWSQIRIILMRIRKRIRIRIKVVWIQNTEFWSDFLQKIYLENHVSKCRLYLWALGDAGELVLHLLQHRSHPPDLLLLPCKGVYNQTLYLKSVLRIRIR